VYCQQLFSLPPILPLQVRRMHALEKSNFTLGPFVHSDPQGKATASNINVAILKEIESGRYSCAARPLRINSLGDEFKASGFMQGSIDVHGSHELFYWTRSRGQGLIVSSETAVVVVHYSPDMGRIVLLRPAGSVDAIIALIGEASAAIAVSCDSVDIVVRYCGTELVSALSKAGWKPLSRPLLPSAYADDETWPEVLIKSSPVVCPHGADGRPVRAAIARHQDRYEYRSERSLLDCGELDFILGGSSRSHISDGFENDFNSAVVSFIEEGEYRDLRFHYLFRESAIIGFGVTGRTTHVAHSYYTGVVKEARLSAYFLWQIYLTEAKEGASALNMGGSETKSLHIYKSQTFGDHSIRFTKVLEFPATSR
ncbi:MAG: hypothetical protein ACRER3_27545, partial [Pseudomonas fluorescens]